MRLIERVPVSNGAAAVVQVEHPERAVRLLFVDGQSKINRMRTPMLHDIARACSQAYNSSEPIDLVVGDFNAVSRSIGFDALEKRGGWICPGFSLLRGAGEARGRRYSRSLTSTTFGYEATGPS